MMQRDDVIAERANRVTRQQMEEAFSKATQKDVLCGVGKFLADLTDDVRPVVAAKIDDEVHYSARVISRVLRNLGYAPLSAELIGKHRRGHCRCPQSEA